MSIKSQLNGHWVILKWVAGVSLPLLIAVGTVTVGAITRAMNQASIAINVAEQHGSELQLIRQDLATLTRLLAQNTEDRFKGVDGVRMERQLDLKMSVLRKDMELMIRSECGKATRIER